MSQREQIQEVTVIALLDGAVTHCIYNCIYSGVEALHIMRSL
jgi:hypothetical protein